jgi:iron complex transport system substrate-binding protein
VYNHTRRLAAFLFKPLAVSLDHTRTLGDPIMTASVARILLLIAVLLTFSPLQAQDTNLTAGCVENYDADVDYFPDKVEMTYATGLEITYFNHYKVVRTLMPYPGAEAPFDYVLVQCGTPVPEGYADAQVVTVPVDSFVALSTTQLPHLKELGHLDSLVGMDTFGLQLTNTPEVIAKIEAGEIVDVGGGAGINVEVLLDMEPDVVMANGFNPETDAHPVLMNAGIFTAINSEWLEAMLLGRAEWIKFTALFFNEEALATEVFDNIVAEYTAVADIASAVPDEERVTVLWNSYSPYSDSWIVPGQATWVGQVLADAGANYVLMDAAGSGSSNFDFETVFEAGADAPIWITNAFQVDTAADLLAQDARYGAFLAFQQGAAYNDTARVNANGGNDFWETGVTNPHLILRDLVKIFYPDLLPDHELVFYKVLQ